MYIYFFGFLRKFRKYKRYNYACLVNSDLLRQFSLNTGHFGLSAWTRHLDISTYHFRLPILTYFKCMRVTFL